MTTSMIVSAPEQREFKKLEEGVYLARCYSIIDIGTHEKISKDGAKDKHEIIIGFEFPTEMSIFKEEEGEQPFVLSRTYTFSLQEKANLRKDLEAWRGKKFTEEELKGFDLANILGKGCQIQVTHSAGKNDPSKTYANIAGIMSLMKGVPVPDQINPTRFIGIDDWNEYLTDCPEYMAKKITTSREYEANFGDTNFDGE